MSAQPQPDFDIDFARGSQAEMWVKDAIREGLRDGRVEVKLDERYQKTGNIFVEFKAYSNKLISYVPSGLSVTKSDTIIFVLPTDMGQVAIAFPAPMLKQLCRLRRQQIGDSVIKPQPRGSNPTKGYVLPVSWIFEILINSQWANDAQATTN